MRPMKRMSCTGCEKCDWLIEYAQEEIFCGSEGEEMLFHDELMHKQLYQLKAVDYSHDWETGLCDDVTIGFAKWDPPTT
jgi:hypothetical protein